MAALAPVLSALATVTDIPGSSQELYQAVQRGRHSDVFEAAMRNLNAVWSTTYYCLSGLRTFSQIGQVALTYIGRKTGSPALRYIDHPGVSATIQGLGLVTSAITLVQESIALFRQTRILKIFRKASWKEQLQNLYALNKEGKLEKTLPSWLYGKIEKQTDENLDFLVENTSTHSKKAQEVLKEVKNITQKKTVVHVLGWISCALCVIGFAALCPPAAAALLIAIGFALWILRWVLNQGLVENPNGGFSLMHLMPQRVIDFLRQTSAVTA